MNLCCILETCPITATQYFDTCIFQPDLNFNITLSFFLPTTKQLFPAALANLAPLYGLISILLTIINKLITLRHKENPFLILPLKFFLSPEYIISPIFVPSVKIIYENNPFSYIIEPKNAVRFKSLIIL